MDYLDNAYVPFLPTCVSLTANTKAVVGVRAKLLGMDVFYIFCTAQKIPIPYLSAASRYSRFADRHGIKGEKRENYCVTDDAYAH